MSDYNFSGLYTIFKVGAAALVVTFGAAVTAPWWAKDDISVDLQDQTKDLAALGRLTADDVCKEANNVMEEYLDTLHDAADGHAVPKVLITCTPQ